MNLYIIYLGLMFLLKFPPFYLFPTTSVLFVSHTSVKFLYPLLVFIIVVFKNKYLGSLNKYPIVFKLILIYLITQSISILPAIDIAFFLKSYHNVVLSLLIFYLSAYFSTSNIKNYSKVFQLFLFICGSFFVCFEFYSIFFQQTFIDFFKQIFQKEVVDAYLVNIDRNRFSFESNLELFIPFFLIPTINNHKIKIGTLLMTISMVCLSVLSNNRTRFIAMLFAVVFSFLFAKKAALSKKIIITILVVILSSFSYFFISRTLSYNNSNSGNIIDRLTSQEGSADYEGYRFRINAIFNSIKISFTYPLGSGLGNYYMFSQNKPVQSTQPKYIKNYYDQVRFSPHNIFAQLLSETGIVGYISFIMLFCYFISSDLKVLIIKSGQFNPLVLGSIIASWIVFITLLFNPPQTLFINGWFWFLRGNLLSYSIRS